MTPAPRPRRRKQSKTADDNTPEGEARQAHALAAFGRYLFDLVVQPLLLISPSRTGNSLLVGCHHPVSLTPS